MFEVNITASTNALKLIHYHLNYKEWNGSKTKGKEENYNFSKINIIEC